MRKQTLPISSAPCNTKLHVTPEEVAAELPSLLVSTDTSASYQLKQLKANTFLHS